MHTKMEGGLLLDVIVKQHATVLKPFTSENESFLIGRDLLLILDLHLNIVNCV